MARAEKRYNAAFLQYTNAVNLTTNSAAFSNLAVATDLNSLPEAKLTKLNDTDFRCDFNGYIEARLGLWAYPDTNDRGWEIGITKNGTTEIGTIRRGNGKADVNRATETSSMKIIPVANGDIIRFQYRSIEGALITVLANSIIASVGIYAET